MFELSSRASSFFRYSIVTGVSVLACALSQFVNSSDQSSNQCAPSWQEHFEGGELAAHWSIQEGDGCAQNLCGWGNNEKQFYRADNLKVEDSLLKITAGVENGQMYSAKITTEGKFAQQFGRFEMRAKLPEGRGGWPAFWLMPDDMQLPWPHEGEIDILEWTGNEPHRVIGAAHFGDVWPDNVHYSETLLTPWKWSDEFHQYAVEWRADRIDWIVDGKVHGTMTPESIAPWPWVFDQKPFYVILNMAVGGTLGGEVVQDDFPATYEVDWVKVWPAECLD